VNLKKVYRIMKILGLFIHQRSTTPRPRVKASTSLAPESNHRWAMDATHIPCGKNGWAHLIAIIDCHDRQIIGWELALRGRAKEAERAIEMACIQRFGTLRPKGSTPVLRSDNGLIFNARRFRDACRDYRISQEFITPYTPEQNGMIERWFRSLKEECVWLHNFTCFEQAKAEVNRWIQFYNQLRPHQALGYQSPAELLNQKAPKVA
jgi:putative transposase